MASVTFACMTWDPLPFLSNPSCNPATPHGNMCSFFFFRILHSILSSPFTLHNLLVSSNPTIIICWPLPPFILICSFVVLCLLAQILFDKDFAHRAGLLCQLPSSAGPYSLYLTLPNLSWKVLKLILPAGLLHALLTLLPSSLLLIQLLTFSKLQPSTYYNVTLHICLLMLFLFFKKPWLKTRQIIWHLLFLNVLPFNQISE